MSWSVSASGKPDEVKISLKEQFAYLLADGNGMDAGEKQTVRQISETINQCLGTFDPKTTVSVSARGHIGFQDWDAKKGAYQQVNLSIV